MKKIMCFSHSVERCGGELAFLEMLRALSGKGYELIGVFPFKGKFIDDCKPYLKAHFIFSLPWWYTDNISWKGKVKQTLKILKSIVELRAFIKKMQPDCIIVNTITIPSPAIAARINNIKVIWFIHEMGNDGGNLFLGEKNSKKIIGYLSTRVICNSNYIKSHYERFISINKLGTVYQAVDIEALDFRKEKTGIITFGIVGRLSEQKGQLLAIKALVLLRNAAVKLLIVGPDKTEYAHQLRELIKIENLEQQVDIIGETSSMELYYQQMDVLLACSTNEALGRTSVEAMKFGIPVILPFDSGHKEMLVDDFNGYFYSVGDADDLASKMTLVLSAETRNRLGENGRIWANNYFSLEHFSSQLENQIESV